MVPASHHRHGSSAGDFRRCLEVLFVEVFGDSGEGVLKVEKSVVQVEYQAVNCEVHVIAPLRSLAVIVTPHSRATGLGVPTESRRSSSQDIKTVIGCAGLQLLVECGNSSGMSVQGGVKHDDVRKPQPGLGS